LFRCETDDAIFYKLPTYFALSPVIHLINLVFLIILHQRSPSLSECRRTGSRTRNLDLFNRSWEPQELSSFTASKYYRPGIPVCMRRGITFIAQSEVFALSPLEKN